MSDERSYEHDASDKKLDKSAATAEASETTGASQSLG